MCVLFRTPSVSKEENKYPTWGMYVRTYVHTYGMRRSGCMYVRTYVHTYGMRRSGCFPGWSIHTYVRTYGMRRPGCFPGWSMELLAFANRLPGIVHPPNIACVWTIYTKIAWVWSIYSVPFFLLVSERSGRNHPRREALVPSSSGKPYYTLKKASVRQTHAHASTR